MGALLAFPNALCLTGVSLLEDDDRRAEGRRAEGRRAEGRRAEGRRLDDRLDDRGAEGRRADRELSHASLGFLLFFLFLVFCDLYPGIYYRVYF